MKAEPIGNAVARQRLYEEMRPHDLTPLWEVLHALVPPRPAVRTLPARWRWADAEPFLRRAGELITAEEAVRRVLILENPGWRGESRATGSLYAGLQLILPGEIAPSHRHSQSALRFVVSGSGAYTAVAGERTTMKPGDFIITPSWAWHDHGNDGDEPVVWLDGLDIPVVAFFEAGFAENGTAAAQAVTAAPGTSLARFGANMLPLEPELPFGPTSPIFCYPYERSRAALEHLRRHAAPDPWHGHALRYVNPATGSHPMPTMATRLQLLPAGFAGRTARTTAGTVFSVVEGTVDVLIAPHANAAPLPPVRFAAGPKDHFVVPPWAGLALSSAADAVLFSFSDAPLQLAAGLLREQRED